MNVLIVSAWDPTSGVLTAYRSLARHLGPRGVTFSGYAFDGWSETTWWTFCDELIDGRRKTLADVLQSGKYDLVHCLDGVYAPPFGVETWVRRARFVGPVVLMSQDTDAHLTSPVHATRYVACSEAAADALAEVADGPVTVIHNGYDEQIFHPGNDVPHGGRPTLLWVGRSYDPSKDVDLFLDVAKHLPEFDAVLVDTDPEASAIRDRLDLLGTRVEHRSLLSPSEMADTYRAAAASGGAFVSTSRWEGFNIAATEAMACGCPVVVPSLPGHAHFIDAMNAVVYGRAEGAEGIVAALRRLEEPALRKGLIERARTQAEDEWTSRAMADAYLRLYQDALAACADKRLSVCDRLARAAWRVALLARPASHRVRRLVGR